MKKLNKDRHYGIALQKANKKDLDFLLQLRKKTIAIHLASAGINLSDQEHLERVKYQFENAYVIRLEQERIGLIKYRELKEVVELLQIQLLPEFQSKGIGTIILDQLVEIVKPKGKDLFLKVLKDNPAKKLYIRYGFKHQGEDEHEYHMHLAL